MKNWKQILPIITFLVITFSAHAQQTREDELAIRELIREAYVNGVFNKGVVRNIELGFSEHFEMIGLEENGQTRIVTYADLIKRVEKNKAAGKYPLPPQEQVSVRYHKIDVEGQLANVKLTFLVGNKARYIDFLALYKYPGGWKLVNKTYREIAVEE